MVFLLYFLGILLWAVNVLHVSAWIVFLWPLIIIPVILLFFLIFGVGFLGVAVTILGTNSFLKR